MSNTFKLRLVYTVLFVLCLTYMFAQTYSYQLNTNYKEKTEEYNTLKNEYDKLQVKINTVNSRENMLDQNPDFEIRENIYYLEPYEE